MSKLRLTNCKDMFSENQAEGENQAYQDDFNSFNSYENYNFDNTRDDYDYDDAFDWREQDLQDRMDRDEAEYRRLDDVYNDQLQHGIDFYESYGKETILNPSDRMRAEFELHGYRMNDHKYNEKLRDHFIDKQKRGEKFDRDADRECLSKEVSHNGKGYRERTLPSDLSFQKLTAIFPNLANPTKHHSYIKAYHANSNFHELARRSVFWYQNNGTAVDIFRTDVGLSFQATHSQDVRDVNGNKRYVKKSIVAVPPMITLKYVSTVCDEMIESLKADRLPLCSEVTMTALIVIVLIRIQLSAFDRACLVQIGIIWSKLKLAEEIIACAFINAGIPTTNNDCVAFHITIAYIEEIWRSFIKRNGFTKLYSETEAEAVRFFRILGLACICKVTLTFPQFDQLRMSRMFRSMTLGQKIPLEFNNPVFKAQTFTHLFAHDCESFQQLLHIRPWPKFAIREMVAKKKKRVNEVRCDSLVNVCSANGIRRSDYGYPSIDKLDDSPSIMWCLHYAEKMYNRSCSEDVGQMVKVRVNEREHFDGGQSLRYDPDSDLFFILPTLDEVPNSAAESLEVAYNVKAVPVSPDDDNEDDWTTWMGPSMSFNPLAFHTSNNKK